MRLLSIPASFSILLLCFSYQSIFAQVYFSRNSGSWNDTTTWSLGGGHLGDTATTVPGNTSGDIVIIGAGHVVDYNADDNASNAATISTLSIGESGTAGYLRFPFSDYSSGDVDELAGDYNLIVTGNVTIGTDGHLVTTRGGDQYPADSTMIGNPIDRDDHNLFIGGNLKNNGILDLQNDNNAAYEVGLHFNSNNLQVISGSGIWDTYDVTYDKTGNQIINRSAGFTASVEAGHSTFVQGTYVHDNSGTFNNQNDSGDDYNNVSFIVLDGTFNMVVNHTSDWDVNLTNGNITVTGGRFNGGSSTGNVTDLTVDGDINVSGTGILNIGNGDPVSSTLPTSGTITIGGGSSSVNGTTLYTHNFVLSTGANLSIENGAVVSVGRGMVGNISLNGATGNGSSLTVSGVASKLTAYGKISIQEDCSFTINNGDVAISPDYTTGGNPTSIDMSGSNATLTMLDGTLNVAPNSSRGDNIDALYLNAANLSVDIQGGTVLLGNPTNGEGTIAFLQNAGETVSLSISGTADVTVADRFERNTVGSISNISLSDNAMFSVGTTIGSGNVDNFFHEGTISISDDAIARFGIGGDLDNIIITGSGTLETGSAGGDKVDINGTFTYASATATCTLYQGMDIESGANLNISAGTIDILPNATTASDTRTQIRGNLTMNGGTINLGTNVTSITAGNLLQVYNGGTLTIGDGSGGANTAQLIIAPNLLEELPSPTTRNVLDIDGTNSVLTINSDGYLSVGGGNIGNLRLNTSSTQFVMNGGTCDITASLTLNNGTAVQVNNGMLNVGTSFSNGANRIIFADNNPTAITSLTLNGGTINVGDGNSQLNIGNGDGNPSFGSATAYSVLEITGGDFNLNGSFNLDDANARLVMSSGSFNLNPQGNQNLDSDVDIFELQRGIADMNGGVVTIVNPHTVAGSGYAMRITDPGNSNGGDRVNSPSGLSSPITFGSTFRFGDGTASLDGSEDGFDLNLSDDHVYGSFIVNNSSGNNRHTQIVSGGSTYQTAGDLTLLAGTFDINDKTFNRNIAGGSLTIDPSAKLVVGNNDGSANFPGSITPFSSYTLNSSSTVEYDGAGGATVSLPGLALFSNLIISGTGNKTLSTTETVNSTLTLASGTFASGANLTMAANSSVLRTGGVLTGTIQGTNTYTIAYEGTTKDSQTPEWSGAGEKSLIVNLNASETLNLHADLIAQGSLAITEGILNDNNHTLTVGGNIINSSLHIGTGAIYLTGSSAQRTIGGDGTGQFENIELDDTNGAIFSAAQTINGTLTLTDGIINTTTSDLLVISSDGSVVGGSGTSYVNGPLEHTENSTVTDTKIFPFGSGGFYRPITLNLTQDDAVTRTYTGSLTESAPADRTLPVELTRVSGARHYTITQFPEDLDGITSASVTINYNVDDRSDVASTLRIAKSDGANWVNLGGTGDTGDEVEGTFEAGTITSGTFTTFSDFVLASSEEESNPLPVELIDFQGISTAGGVELLWTTASETNNSHFLVERLVSGSSFDEVVQVEGGGDSATPLYYEILDTQAPFGTVYYRLKQVDFDGTSTRSRTITVIHNPQEATISIQPNPVENYQTVITATGLATEQSVTMQITDMTGFMVRNYQRNTDSIGGITITLAELDALASGIYTVTLVSDRFRHTEKLIIP